MPSHHDAAFEKPGPYTHPLRDKVIIVTGAASGIGRATAIALAYAGAKLALTDVDGEGGRETCEIVKDFDNCSVVFSRLDVTEDEAVQKLVRRFATTYKRIDGLVNCAAVHPHNPPSHKTPNEVFQNIMDINVKGVLNFSNAYLGLIAGVKMTPPEGGWSIVNVGGIESFKGVADSSAYVASKHAILGLTRSMAREYAAQNIRVNLVAPGAIDTPLLHDKLAPTEDSVKEHIETVPMKRVGDPEEVAEVICFLLSKQSSYVTGVCIPVDGGWTA